MKIAFDYQTFAAQKYGGITRYYTSLVRELAVLGETPRVFAPLYWNRYLRQLPTHLVRGRYTDRFLPGYAYYFNRLYNTWSAKLQMSLWRPQVVHETYYAKKPTGPAGIPTVITVYDMIHELFADEFPPYDKTAAVKLAAVQRADHIICISTNTRDDLIRLTGVPRERISVVYLGADVPDDVAPDGSPGHSVTRAPFLLYVGDRRGYKNFGPFLEAMASSSSLHRDFSIVAFGSQPFSRQELDMIASLGLSKTIEHMSGGDASLSALYGEARAFVYPSLYEGFGLPPLEAMARGCPVVASNTSSMREVVGDAGELFDPTDVGAISRSIESVVYSDEYRRTLIGRGADRVRRFSWQRCAEETLAVYRTLAAE